MSAERGGKRCNHCGIVAIFEHARARRKTLMANSMSDGKMRQLLTQSALVDDADATNAINATNAEDAYVAR